MCNQRQPPPAIFCFAGEEAKERLLNSGCDRTAFARANRQFIDRANRRHLSRSTSEEEFVRQVEHFARQVLFAHLVSQLARQGDHRIAGDARQQRRCDRRRVDDAVTDEEQILARSFGDPAMHIERNAFGVAWRVASMTINCDDR